MLEILIGGLLRGVYVLPIVVGCLLATRHGSYLSLWQPQSGLVAAYTTYYLVESLQLPVAAGVALGLIVGTGFGFAVHLRFFQPCIEKAAPYAALLYGLAVLPLVSSFFGLVTSGYAMSFRRARGSWELFVAAPVSETIRLSDLAAMATAAFVVPALMVLIGRTRLGLEYRAVCSNRRLARDLGLRVHLIDRVVPATAVFLTSVGGLLYALKFGIQPESMVPVAIKAVAIVVALGSVGGVFAAAVATLALGMMEAAVLATPAISAFEHALAYLVLMVALVIQFVLAPSMRRWYWARRSPHPAG